MKLTKQQVEALANKIRGQLSSKASEAMEKFKEEVLPGLMEKSAKSDTYKAVMKCLSMKEISRVKVKVADKGSYSDHTEFQDEEDLIEYYEYKHKRQFADDYGDVSLETIKEEIYLESIGESTVEGMIEKITGKYSK